MGPRPGRLSRGQRPPARAERRPAVAGPRVACGCPARGPRRPSSPLHPVHVESVAWIDRAQERPVRGLLPLARCSRTCASSPAATRQRWRWYALSPAAVRRGAARQDGHLLRCRRRCCLIAVVEARRAARRATSCRCCRSSPSAPRSRASPSGWSGTTSAPPAPTGTSRSLERVPDRRPRALVLRSASSSGRSTSPSSTRAGRSMRRSWWQYLFPGRGARGGRGALRAARAARPRAARGVLLLRRHAGAGARLLRRLPDALLVRRRSLPVPGEHRPDRRSPCLPSRTVVGAAARRPRAPARWGWRWRARSRSVLWPGGRRAIYRDLRDAVARHAGQEPGRLDGAQQPRAAALRRAVASTRRWVTTRPRCASSPTTTTRTTISATRSPRGATWTGRAELRRRPADRAGQRRGAQQPRQRAGRPRRWEEAAEQYRAALRGNPRYADAHNNLANVLALRGDGESAAAHYRAALRIDPTYAEARRNLALILAARGEKAAAIAELREALRLRPDYGEARATLESLQGP